MMKVRQERKAKGEDSHKDFLTPSGGELLNHVSFRVKSRNFTSGHGYNPQTSPHIALHEIVKKSGSSLLDPRYSVLVARADTLFSECSGLNEKVSHSPGALEHLLPRRWNCLGEGQEVWSCMSLGLGFGSKRTPPTSNLHILLPAWGLGYELSESCFYCWTYFLLEL